MEHYTEAQQLYSRALALHLDAGQPSLPMEMGIICLNTGRYDSAYYFCHRSWLQDSTNGYTAYCMGAALFLQGKVNQSMAWLGTACRKSIPGPAFLRKDRQLTALRDNKTFKELLKKQL
jgi:hypothetical protein